MLASREVKLAVSIVSPPGYPHSEAFREVAETLHWALRALGHDAVLTTELSLPGRRHIVLGSNLLPGLGVRPAPGSILYNLEQVQAGSSWMRPQLLELFRQFPVWDYSARNVDRWVELGVPRTPGARAASGWRRSLALTGRRGTT